MSGRELHLGGTKKIVVKPALTQMQGYLEGNEVISARFPR